MNGHKVSFKIYFSNNKQRGVIISSADTFTFDNSQSSLLEFFSHLVLFFKIKFSNLQTGRELFVHETN